MKYKALVRYSDAYVTIQKGEIFDVDEINAGGNGILHCGPIPALFIVGFCVSIPEANIESFYPERLTPNL